ncbi:hypothetical protein GGR52DRAFT_146886 [Hypoxylon sp. FL1284]|nr:hypothetical protein GGR52DRAFT_146886 [Hypoxylon sp. FL1284]
MASGARKGSSDAAPAGYTSAHRVPTDSSYYSFDGTPWNGKFDSHSQTWMYAREATQQQAILPANYKARPYPSTYGNIEELPLSTPGARRQATSRQLWLHHPLVPGRATTWGQKGTPRGPVSGNKLLSKYATGSVGFLTLSDL